MPLFVIHRELIIENGLGHVGGYLVFGEFIVKRKGFGKRTRGQEGVVLVIELEIRSFNEAVVITVNGEADPFSVILRPGGPKDLGRDRKSWLQFGGVLGDGDFEERARVRGQGVRGRRSLVAFLLTHDPCPLTLFFGFHSKGYLGKDSFCDSYFPW